MKAKNDISKNDKEDSHSFLQNKVKEIAFLTGIGGMSIFFGFGLTMAMVKKKDPNMFNKGLIGHKGIPESGGGLALRALAWGTLYSVTGVSILCFGIYKLTGSKSMADFTSRVQSAMPNVPKNPDQGKSDFKTVRELVNYITEKDQKDKNDKGS